MYRNLTDAYFDLKARWKLACLPKPSLGNGPPVVMTTHSTRMLTAHYAALCILGGIVRPRRFIIYVPSAPSKNLLALKQHGVEVYECKPMGVHDKWYHYAQDNTDPFVTVDDDFVYPLDLLATLTAAVASEPKCVTALRARLITPEKYATWPLVTDTLPSHLVMALGCGGVYYPRVMVSAMKASSLDFLQKCPKADDIWLKRLAFESDTPVRLGVVGRQLPMLAPGTPGTGLWHENVTQGRNDTQWAATKTFGMQTLLDRTYTHTNPL